MARLLSCPHCRAEFAFDEWARGASCPACGRRLSFLELGRVEHVGGDVAAPAASATPVVAPPTVEPSPASPIVCAPTAPAAPPAAAATPAPITETPAEAAATDATLVFLPPTPAAFEVPAAASPAAPGAPAAAVWTTPVARSSTEPREYTVGGKPLHWSVGWTVVAVIWAIVAVGMVTVRVSMGPTTVMTPAETAAVNAVRQIRLPTGASTETVLRYAATHDLTLEGHVATIPPGGTQMWYAFDRPWEHRIYVSTTLPGTSMMGKNVVLQWTVTGGTATPVGATRAALTKTAQTMAHPPSPNSVPAVPGIIPSIPPDLQ
jgi:hypothetical protein